VGDNQLQYLADALTNALNEYLKIKVEITDAQRRRSTHEPDTFELRALGSILHDLYNGAESICRMIAKEIDQQLPVGANWHKDLLDQMAQPVPKTRPAILKPQTVSSLETYRSFRHVVRNIYGFRLDWAQMKPLLNDAITTINMFEADLEEFIAFLRAV